MCGSSASNAYGSGGTVNGPVGAGAAGVDAGWAVAVRSAGAAAQASVTSAVVFKAFLRVIIGQVLSEATCSVGPVGRYRRAAPTLQLLHNPRRPQQFAFDLVENAVHELT